MTIRKGRLLFVALACALISYVVSYIIFRANGTLTRYWNTQNGNSITLNMEREYWRQLEYNILMASKKKEIKVPNKSTEQRAKHRQAVFDTLYWLPIRCEVVARGSRK